MLYHRSVLFYNRICIVSDFVQPEHKIYFCIFSGGKQAVKSSISHAGHIYPFAQNAKAVHAYGGKNIGLAEISVVPQSYRAGIADK